MRYKMSNNNDSGVLGSVGDGLGFGVGQSALNIAAAPLNMYLADKQMRAQERAQKRMTEHNAKVTDSLQHKRNLSQFAELAQGAERAGFSPLAALGQSFSSASAASAPTPSASTPQVASPSVLEASQAALTQSQARLNNAQAKNIENTNEDTTGFRKTLQLNLPAFFRKVAKRSDDDGIKKSLFGYADDIEQNGTTKGAFDAFIKTVFDAPKQSMESLRSISGDKLRYMITEGQIHDPAVLQAFRKLPEVDQNKMLMEISKLSSDIALNGAKITLTSAEMQHLLASAKKLAAEWSQITHSDYNTALAEGRIWDFITMMSGNLINSAAGNIGEVGAAAVTKKPPRRATGRLVKTLETTNKGFSRQTKTVMSDIFD